MWIFWLMVLVAIVVTAHKIRQQRRRRRRYTVRFQSQPGEVFEFWR